MANGSDYNIAFSTISAIYFLDNEGNIVQDTISQKDLNVIRRNSQCEFQRVEFFESVTDIFPTGSIIVRNLVDIISFLQNNKIAKLLVYYQNKSYSVFDITSAVYLDNIASATDESMVAINFTNLFYKYSQSTSLNAELLKQSDYWKIPQVYRIKDFVSYLWQNVLVNGFLNQQDIEISTPEPTIDDTSNYVLYKPLNPRDYRLETPTDDLFQYLNYLAQFAAPGSIAASKELSGPRFMFWTDFDNKINFKYFAPSTDTETNPQTGNGENNENQENQSLEDSLIDELNLRFGIYNGDNPLVKLSDGKYYRKIYHMHTDPSFQYVSKNYHYIRKTPKHLDVELFANGVKGSSYDSNILSYQFQDEGQKYNIEVFSSKNTGISGGITAGSNEIVYEKSWGYNSDLVPVNDNKSITNLIQNFGTEKTVANINFMGNTGYFSYMDNPEMWKNMFDLTPVHPHYPDDKTLPPEGIVGSDTHLFKIIQIRYNNFIDSLSNDSSRLELARKIEKQNFIMYVLCCIAKEEETFFALLTRYERDNTTSTSTEYGPYRYNWVKLNFNSPYNLTGPSTEFKSTESGGTYYIHQLEKWEKDGIWKGSTTQDDTWAINLNERSIGITGNSQYLAPGWVSPINFSSFKWRPIGITGPTYENSGYINHLVKMTSIPYSKLLLDSNNLIGITFLGKYLYYFTVENVVDGQC
jgi:hypothetical protein